MVVYVCEGGLEWIKVLVVAWLRSALVNAASTEKSHEGSSTDHKVKRHFEKLSSAKIRKTNELGK